MDNLKIPVHIEVQLKANSSAIQADIVNQLLDYLKHIPLFMDGDIELRPNDKLWNDVQSVRICDLENQEVSYWNADILIHCYKLVDAGPEKDFLDGEEDLPACDQWELPNTLLANLWNTIVCDGDIKRTLLGYASTAMIFTNASVDADIVSWNRMILLHGPPGTGKTTLCKALAQKVFIRNCENYGNGVLLEINSHSLFSRWFSESGKLVMKLFDHIAEIADEEGCFVAVLIDEIESIASARQASVSSNEPSDAVRVVNAVLTSLDALKRRKNVLVLCTSNMTSAIDPAFLDRVDLMIYMGPPSTLARYQILHSCLSELMDKGVVSPSCLLLSDPRDIVFTSSEEIEEGVVASKEGVVASKEGVSMDEGGANSMGIQGEPYERQLWDIATRCEGVSGRALRKLPLKAHAMFLQRPQVSMDQFIAALLATVNFEQSNRTIHGV